MLLEGLEDLGNEEALGSVIGAKAEAVTTWEAQANSTDTIPDSEKQESIRVKKEISCRRRCWRSKLHCLAFVAKMQQSIETPQLPAAVPCPCPMEGQ